MISRKTQAEIDKWESRTHVFVNFDNVRDIIHLEGEFEVDELSEITSIQRKRLKELQPPPKRKQKGLFDD